MTIRGALALVLVLAGRRRLRGSLDRRLTDALPSPRAGHDARAGIGGVATAGPVCPVEKNPPIRHVRPRPVEGAVLVVRDAAGTEVARTTTAADGTFFAELPAGFYVVTPQPAQGLLGTPGPQSVTVTDGATSPTRPCL